MEPTRSSSSTGLARSDELFTNVEALALAGFLGEYSGLTRDAYTLDLRQFATWCAEQRLALFGVRRSDIEAFARHVEALGRARATIARRLGTLTCFYRYAEEVGLIELSPVCARAPSPPRLRVACHRPGPQ